MHKIFDFRIEKYGFRVGENRPQMQCECRSNMSINVTYTSRYIYLYIPLIYCIFPLANRAGSGPTAAGVIL